MKHLSVRIAAGLALGLFTSACSTSGAGFDVGLQRVALDLAFEDGSDDGAPVPTAVAIDPSGAPASSGLNVNQATFDTDGDDGDGDNRPSLPPVIVAECPPIGPDAIVSEIAGPTTEAPPAAGRYLYREEGTFEVTLPPLKGPLPPVSIREIRHPQVVPLPEDYKIDQYRLPNSGAIPFPYPEADNPAPGNPATGDEPVAETIPVRDAYQWVEVQPLGQEDFIARTYSAGEGAIALIKAVYSIGGQEVVFQPLLGVTIMPLGPDLTTGATFESVGTDFGTGVSMIVTGVIERKETINACGTPIDTWRVALTERIASINEGGVFTSMTDNSSNPPSETPGAPGTPVGPQPLPTAAEVEGEPNTYWWATGLDGLLVQMETHTTTQIGPATISLDSLSTINSPEPFEVPEAFLQPPPEEAAE